VDVVKDPARFEIVSYTWQRAGLRSRIVGVIRNNGPEAGVQIRASTLDAEGRIVRSRPFWPAGTRNIDRGATESFASPGPFVDGAVSMVLQAVEVRVFLQCKDPCG
jgi:hypothetical protein